MPVVDAVLFICAAQLPECPPDTLVSTTPALEPDVFHPEVSVSKPGFVTRLMVSEAVLVFPALFPVTVCGPPERRCAGAAAAGSVRRDRERRARGDVAE